MEREAEKNAASYDSKDIGDREKAFFPTGKIDQTGDKEMVHEKLNENEFVKVLDFS